MKGISSSFYLSLLGCRCDNRPEMPKHAAKSVRTLNKSHTHIVQTVLVHNFGYEENKSSERCTGMPKFNLSLLGTKQSVQKLTVLPPRGAGMTPTQTK